MIVANEAVPSKLRLSQLPSHYGLRRIHAVILAASCGLDAIKGTVNGSGPYMQEAVKLEFDLTDVEAPLVLTAVLLGSVIGVFVFGKVADDVGRRAVCVMCVSTIVCMSLLHLGIPSDRNGFRAMIALRFGLGIPYGGLVVNHIPLLVEFLPDHVRGTAGVAANLGWSIGVLYLFMFMPVYKNDAPWRSYFAYAPLAPGIVTLLLLWQIPESPRWLSVKGRKKGTEESLTAIFASKAIYGVAAVGPAPQIEGSDAQGHMPSAVQVPSLKLIGLLFAPGLRWTTVLTTLLYLLLAAPSNLAWAWGPLILEQASGTKLGINVFRTADTAGLFGTVFAMIIIDRVSRAHFMAMAFFIQVLAVTILAFGTQIAVSIIVAAWILRCFVDTMLWSVIGVYMSEAFPTELRVTACGLALMTGRLASVVLPMAAGIFIRESFNLVLFSLITMFTVASLLALTVPREMSCSPMDDMVSSS